MMDGLPTDYGILGLLVMAITKVAIDVGRIAIDQHERKRQRSIPPPAMRCEAQVAELHSIIGRADPTDPMGQPLIYRLHEMQIETLRQQTDILRGIKAELENQRGETAKQAATIHRIADRMDLPFRRTDKLNGTGE